MRLLSGLLLWTICLTGASARAAYRRVKGNTSKFSKISRGSEKGNAISGEKHASAASFFLSNLSISELFDQKKIHVYFLSGDNSTRKENCLKMMKKLQLEPRHYDFIHGPMEMSSQQVAEAIQTGALSPRWNQSRYHMGIKRYLCHLGKMKVLQAFLGSAYEEMILYEDDVALSTKYNSSEAAEYMRLMLTIPSQDYDMQYLGYCFECYRYGYDKVELSSSMALREGKQFHYARVLMPLCNHAVLFKKKSFLC